MSVDDRELGRAAVNDETGPHQDPPGSIDAEDDASPQRILNVSQFLVFGFLNIHHTLLPFLEVR